MHWTSIDERNREGVRVMDLHGTIEIGREDLLSQRIQQLLASGDRTFLLNLEALTYIDSAGLGELVRTHQLVEQHAGHIVFVNVGQRIRRHLATAGLLSVLHTAETEAEGLRILAEEH
jgi:anti-sigma B factor antagonist